MPWAKRLAPLLPRLRSLRHKLHRSPETAFQEGGTAAAVAGWLRDEAGMTALAKGVGGTGLIFRVEGCGAGSADSSDAPSVLLRSELDGLPLIEASGVAHSSKIHGRHHACGHDGHACMLAAALTLLHENRDEWNGVGNPHTESPQHLDFQRCISHIAGAFQFTGSFNRPRRRAPVRWPCSPMTPRWPR